MSTIYVISGPEIGRSFDLPGNALYLGRAPDNDIQIKDRFVSRRHLRILKKGERYFLEDLGSKNGTFMDGELIKEGVAVELREGSPVVLGMSVICLGEQCPEDILELLQSMRLPGQVREGVSEPPQDREMTPQKNMDLLRKVSEVHSESLNLVEILEKILDHVFGHFTWLDRGAIILLDRETGEISEVVSKVKGETEDRGERYCQDVVEQVIEEGKAIMFPSPDAEVEGSDLPDTLKLLKIRSVICVPLISQSRVRGVIYVDSVRTVHGFRKEDLSLFRALTIPTSNAIENAVLYSRRRRS
ncbi:MAG: FHA domain-containing protein [Deltaproteobacteria bacterium]|nr:FHA domain-containing protein [Deltaproteobacteria bacterium]